MPLVPVTVAAERTGVSQVRSPGLGSAGLEARPSPSAADQVDTSLALYRADERTPLPRRGHVRPKRGAASLAECGGGAMGQASRGGMWCNQCQELIAGQKTTHRARGLTSIVAVPLTGGASLMAAKSERWHCPHCGGPAVASARVVPPKTDRRAKIDVSGDYSLTIHPGHPVPALAATQLACIPNWPGEERDGAVEKLRRGQPVTIRINAEWAHKCAAWLVVRGFSVTTDAPESSESLAQEAPSSSGPVQALRDLSLLQGEGLITSAEYEAKRAELLKRL